MARTKGSLNKRTQEVIDRLNELGFDPIQGMVQIANEARQQGDLALSGAMCKELAQYMYPKIKSITHQVNKDSIEIEYQGEQ